MRYKILLVGVLLFGCSALRAGETDGETDRDDDELPDVESVIDLRGQQLKDGNWRTCAGYVTRNESEQFCEEEVPDDWREFEFNGQIFYVQPLN